MAEKRGKRSRAAAAAQRDCDPPPPDPSVSDPQVARARIRQRWEFASVLNFLSVFKPVIGGDLKISAEEIEMALITPNDDLARLHVAVLKGIPPVNRKMTEADMWVTVTCKKLATWWPWVAEGDNPLNSDNGKEMLRYKALDPVTRMLILKALCEVRVLQDDVLSYVSDELKNGTKLTTFRKERIGNVGNGVSYWYDGDSVIGHRLYKEVVQVESKHKSRWKGRPAQPTINYKWETLATDLEEFQKLSDNLSASDVHAEAAVGEIIKTEIVPVIAELQKKKERALKRQQREVLQLHGFPNHNGVGMTRSCRERRPVCYTFDEYDRSIDEAIQISKKLKTNVPKKAKQVRLVSRQKDAFDGNEEADRGSSDPDEIYEDLADDENNDFKEHDDEESDYNEQDDEHNDDEDDYNEKGEEDNKQQVDNDEKDEDRGVSNIEEEDDNDDSDDFTSSDTEEEKSPKQTGNPRNIKSNAAAGVRRSKRFVEPSKALAETKKRLRQRPTRNSAQMVSDSEDCSQENEKAIEIVSDSETKDSAASGEGSDDDGSQDSGDGSDE